jgi:septum formation protein
MERTLILVKPDAFRRDLTGEIIARFERKGLRLVAMNLLTMTRDLAERHYAEHEGKPFYEELVTFITSGPLVAFVWPCSSPRTDPRPVSRLVLASRSPQRRAILAQLGVDFSVQVPEVEELASGPPHEIALENAYRKASAVAASGLADGPVLGVDTVVALGARVYGKPAYPEEARRTLTALAGRRHTVVSGVCVIEDGRSRTAAAQTAVEFRALSDRLLDWYVASGEWRDRAGGYAIQGRGAALVAAIEGDYLNVVGLPVPTLLELVPGLLGG